MKIDRASLVNALTLLRPGLSSKEVIEQAGHIIFADGRALAFNDEVLASIELDLGGIEGAIPADPLLALLTKLSAEEVDIALTEVDGGSTLSITTAKTKAGLRIEESKLKTDTVVFPEKWFKVPEDFVDMATLCALSCSSDMSNPVLACLNVKGTVLQGCDQFQLTVAEVSGKMGAWLLPATMVSHLKGAAKFSVVDGWAHFQREDGVTLSIRTMEGEYPDVSALLDVDGSEVQFPEGVGEALDRAGIFAKSEFEQDERVDVKLDGGYLYIGGTGELGWLKERLKLPTPHSGDPVAFSVNPRYFARTVKLHDTVLVSAERLKLTGEGWQHVVALT